MTPPDNGAINIIELELHDKKIYNMQDEIRQLQIKTDRIESAVHNRADRIEEKLNALNANIEQLKNFVAYFISKSNEKDYDVMK